MADDIPQWALERACELFNATPEQDWAWTPKDANDPRSGLPQFARYIAAHEEAPVDPLIEALRVAFPISLASSGTLRNDAEYLRSQLLARGLKIVSSSDA